MDMQLDPLASRAETSSTGSGPAGAPAALPTSSPAAPPVARYVLVEDLDYLYRTGESRQILVLRWAV